LDLSKDGNVQVGVRNCKDPQVIFICCVNGVENCIIVTIIFVFEPFEQRRLFYPILVARYCKSPIGNDCFWFIKDAWVMEDAPHEDILKKVSTNYKVGKYLVRMNLSP